MCREFIPGHSHNLCDGGGRWDYRRLSLLFEQQYLSLVHTQAVGMARKVKTQANGDYNTDNEPLLQSVPIERRYFTALDKRFSVLRYLRAKIYIRIYKLYNL